MPTIHEELIRLMQTRMDYIRIIASLKFILKKPIYVPVVEQEQQHYLIGLATQMNLNIASVRNFMKVLCKISREIQRKMHAIWSLDQNACLQFLLSQTNHIPMVQFSVFSTRLSALDNYSLFLCNQLIDLLRFFIRFVDTQIISLLCSLTDNFSLGFFKEELRSWSQLPNEALLYKLFLLMNTFVKRNEGCL